LRRGLRRDSIATVIDVDGYLYDRRDALGTIAALAPWWQQLADGRSLPASFDDCVADQVGVLAALAPDTPESGDLESVWRLGEVVHRRIARSGGEELVLAPSLRLLRRAVDEMRAFGSFPARHEGEVAQLSSSGGGVPKLPIAEVEVDLGGVIGDVQRTRVHHGRPWQALCIWAAEVVDAFAAAGHPIRYGAAGENVTVRDIPWSLVQAGVRLRIGEVLAECTLFSLPCSQNARFFDGGDFLAMHHERGPVSRIYASVLEGGGIRAGDRVVLEP
jgi:hypothetical protein